MADPPSTGSAGGKNSLGFLARKIGPVPVWLIAVGLVAAWYWYSNYGPGKSSSAAATADQIDPETGVSYASELGAADQQIADLQSQQPSGGGTIPGGTGTTTNPPPVNNGGASSGPPVTTGPVKITAPAPPGGAAKPAPTPKPVPRKPGPVKKPVTRKVTTRPARTAAAPAAPATASRWRAAA